MSTKSTKSTQATARSTKEPAMKKTTEKKSAPKTTAKPAKKGAPVVEPATEQPALVDDTTAAVGIHTAAAIAVSESDPDAAIEAIHEAAMKVAREAIERGADAKTCSDAVAVYAAGAIDEAEFKARLEAATPVASDAPVDAPAEEPAPVAATTADDAPVANTDATVGACDRCGRTDVTLRAEGGLTLHDRPDGSACNLAIDPIAEVLGEALEGAPEPPAPTSDARDAILARAKTLEPAAQRAFFEGMDKKELHGLVERATGQKTSGRLSPKGAVDRLLAALAPPPPAEIKATQATSSKPTAQATSTRGRAAELPPVGTVLTNVDRHGKERVRCVVVEGGVDYAGKTYTSLSAAAIIASRDLGNTTKQTSGPRFWGLLAGATRAPKAAKGLDLDVIARAWERYRERAEAATKSASDGDKAKLHALLNGHTSALTDLAAVVA